MINKKDMAILYIFIVLEIILLLKSKEIANNIIDTSKTFIFLIFPYLFPNMVLANIISEYQVYKIIPKIIRKHIKINRNVLNIYILSIICGSPTNASIIKKYLNNSLINEKEAEILLYTTQFINPFFIIGSVGIGIFNSLKVGIILVILLIVSNLIKAYLLRKNFTKNNMVSINNHKKLLDNFNFSIKTSISNILVIYGVIIVFNILIFLITNILNTSQVTTLIIKTTLEITSGIQSLSTLNINTFIKYIIAYYSLAFGGICIHMQIFTILNEKKISYIKYLIFRFLII